MKYKVKNVIEAEFECNNEKDFKIKAHEAISDKFNKCIFDPIEYDAEELLTITREDGIVFTWDKKNKLFKKTTKKVKCKYQKLPISNDLVDNYLKVKR